MATSKRIVIEPSALDKNAPPDVTVMYRLCHKPVGRRPPEVIADYNNAKEAQHNADILAKQRVPFLYLTWWRRDGKQVRKWATLLYGKSRHYKVTVPYVEGVTDEMVKMLLQSAILHAAAKPREYNETNIKVRADPDLNRLEVDDQLVQVRLPQPIALVLRSMPATEASALVEKAITGDNAEPATTGVTEMHQRINVTENVTREVVLPNYQVEGIVLCHLKDLRTAQNLGFAGNCIRNRDAEDWVCEADVWIRPATALDKATIAVEEHIHAAREARFKTD